ncbi:hypothetical protein ACIPZF_09130 [Pseudomonas sp. NPDC089752]|uniref:hypothetical protein n=1 Tax=Pseudomonas sp. NPDC089752 TaxID=3364472 RepID=UPI00381455A9
MDFDHDLPLPGDILLLRGKSLFTKPNITFQAISRMQRSSYSHVAMVTGQNMIMDANPGIGITLRQWDEVRHSYDVGKSVLVRHKTANRDAIQNVIQRAHYYFGQKYKLTALMSNEVKFSDNKGIVCSQFIAQIFQDCQLTCSKKLPRKTLPIDIHTFTSNNPEWAVRPLCEVEIGLRSLPKDLAYSMAEANHNLDIYVAASLKQTFDFSLTFKKLTSEIASLVEASKGEMAPITAMMKYSSKTDISIAHLISSWQKYFIDPNVKAAFLHEEGSAAQEQVKIFTKACELVRHHCVTANEAHDQLSLLLTDYESNAKSLKPNPNEVEVFSWLTRLCEIQEAIQSQVVTLDWILASEPSNIEAAKHFSFQKLFDEYALNPKSDATEAMDTLAIIANFCNLCESWARQRPHYDQILRAQDVLENGGDAAIRES